MAEPAPRALVERTPIHPVLLYDGDCGVCNRAVQFVLAHEAGEHFRFASLQSDVGRTLATQHGLEAAALDTLIVVEPFGAHVRSGAVLAIVRALRWQWRVLLVLALIPRTWRDAAYNWFAARRHRFAASSAACLRLTPAQRGRFLDITPTPSSP